MSPIAHRGASVRCPFCLEVVWAEHDRESKQRIECEKCQRSFRVRDGLDAPQETYTPFGAPEPEADEIAPRSLRDSWGDNGILMYVGLILVIAVLFFMVCMRFPGTAWILCYLGLGVAGLIASTVIRHKAQDAMWVSLVPVLAFLAVGGARIWYGLSHGLDSVAFLVIAMVVIPFLYFLRLDEDTDSGFYVFTAPSFRGGGWGSWGGGCGSNCGGGCSSCGGGCGGCS